MRIWSLHPKYLDRQGLLAVWSETWLAQKVLKGETKGYHRHPQLIQFRRHPDTFSAVEITSLLSSRRRNAAAICSIVPGSVGDAPKSDCQ